MFEANQIQTNRFAASVCTAAVLACAFVPFAAQAVTIHNSVDTSASTGGNVVRVGADGTDGTDGRDGADGQDGADGADGASSGSSSVHIQTIVNGEVVTDIRETTGSGTASASATYDSSDTSSSGSPALHAERVTVHASATAEREPDTVAEEPALFTSDAVFGFLTSIRLMLITYATHII